MSDDIKKIKNNIKKYIEATAPESNLVEGSDGLATISDHIKNLNQKLENQIEKKEEEKQQQLEKDIEYLNAKDAKKNEPKDGLKIVDKETGKETLYIFKFADDGIEIKGDHFVIIEIDKNQKNIRFEDLFNATLGRFKKDIVVDNKDLTAKDIDSSAIKQNIELWINFLEDEKFKENFNSSIKLLDISIDDIVSSFDIGLTSPKNDKNNINNTKSLAKYDENAINDDYLKDLIRFNLEENRKNERFKMNIDSKDMNLVLDFLEIEPKKDIELMKMEVENSLNDIRFKIESQNLDDKKEILEMIDKIDGFVSGKSNNLIQEISPKKIEVPSSSISPKEFSKIYNFKETSREID